MAFQAQTATGKLNAVMMPIGPSGCHCSIIRCRGPLAGDRQAVELARQPDGEVAHVDHFLDLALALGADLARLEGDQEAQVGLPARRASPIWRTTSPRRGGGTIRQLGKAWLARVDDPLVIGGRGRAHRRQRLAGRRVRRMNLALARGQSTPSPQQTPLLISPIPSRRNRSSNMSHRTFRVRACSPARSSPLHHTDPEFEVDCAVSRRNPPLIRSRHVTENGCKASPRS